MIEAMKMSPDTCNNQHSSRAYQFLCTLLKWGSGRTITAERRSHGDFYKSVHMNSGKRSLRWMAGFTSKKNILWKVNPKSAGNNHSCCLQVTGTTSTLSTIQDQSLSPISVGFICPMKSDLIPCAVHTTQLLYSYGPLAAGLQTITRR